MFYRSFSSIYVSIAVVVFMQTMPFFLRASWIDFVKSINSSRIQWKNTGSGSKLFGEIFMKKQKQTFYLENMQNDEFQAAVAVSLVLSSI